MRKFTLLFLLVVCCLSIKAQQITFLSIPLKGNVETFTNKLKGVGISLDKEISKNLEIGKRAFDVSIFKYPAYALVEYDPITKNVYEGVIMFTFTGTPEELGALADEFAINIEEKYSTEAYKSYVEETEYYSLPANHYIIYQALDNKYLGEIYIYMRIQDYKSALNKGKCNLQIMYRNNEAPSFEDQMKIFY